MSKVSPELLAHREWLGQIGQVGLVVSANVLVKHDVFVNRQRAVEAQTQLRALIPEDDEEARVFGVERIFREVLHWPPHLLAGGEGGPELPESLTIALPAYEDYLKPTYAVPAPGGSDWLLLVEVLKPGVDLDKAAPPEADGWRASPQARFERLLRETGVGIGILINGVSLRLVYAPKGESSGYLTFTFRYLLETQGRPMAGALCALLDPERVSDVGPEAQRLPALLKESRKSQNDVSTDLADQVLEALWELVRGFQQANDSTQGQLLGEALREDSREVYGGMLTTLMRLVFILYAEDRSLMPAGDVYQRHYSVTGLFERLREDQARHPDTMDARYGAWTQLLALFRLIHDGGSHGSVRFIARHGRLFDPNAYPFLEGRPHGTSRSKGERVTPPKVSDGVVHRVLRNLLILDGERLSYRTLDVEQIGSVYEAMMGFALEQATGPAIAVSPKHVVIHLHELLEQPAKDRAKWLAEHAELKVKPEALAKAKTPDEVVEALGKKVSRYTPQKLQVKALYLQPTEERRRSGSHYTPRTLTEPIVRTTFRPIFERLGENATPEEILDLKVCDPAMGSGAFLVESCRFLAERLVKAWEQHNATPSVPDDEDVLTFARRLVAEQCLYGVDKNVFAVDLAKLSLWLATLAKDHPFTFLDHSLRHGDSLVGLSREQIASFNWDVGKQVPLLRDLLNTRVNEAERIRAEIRGLATSDDVPRKTNLLRAAEDAIADVRLVGDVVVSAFFERDKPKARAALLAARAGQIQDWLNGGATQREALSAVAVGLRERPQSMSPFHWQVEFPEVFSRADAGFDAFVGNPPFMGGTMISGSLGDSYLDFLKTMFERAGNRSDLVAYFLRKAFDNSSGKSALGFLATNTISQGDTRKASLAWICSRGGEIFSCSKRVRWPGMASVVVSAVHFTKTSSGSLRELDGKIVSNISPFLISAKVNKEPEQLTENLGIVFEGVKPYGQGFLFMDGDEDANPISAMHAVIAREKRNKERIFPYIGGEELNEDPSQATPRFAIDFGVMSEEEASHWPDLLEICRQRVKAERSTKAKDVAEHPWWQYWRPRLELYNAIEGLERVLAISRVGQACAFTFLPTGMIYAESLDVFALTQFGAFAILQSRVHETWARLMGSSMKDDLRYTPSDCFVTFPAPFAWSACEALDDVGRIFFDARAKYMAAANVGLTTTYHRFNDPKEKSDSIRELRMLRDVMDRAVLRAYSWHDLEPACAFLLDYEDEGGADKPSKKRKPYRYRWPDDTRDEVLGRLLELNARRAKEQSVGGETAAIGKRNKITLKKTKTKGGAWSAAKLFD